MLLLPDGHAVGAGQVGGAVVPHRHAVPRLQCPPCVHHLALLHVVFPEGAVLAGLPLSVRQAHRRAVHLQLVVQRHVLAVQVPVAVHAGAASVPAVAQGDGGLIFAGVQQRRHVVALDKQPFIIGGRAGGQHRVAHPNAVECRRVQAVAGDVQPGPVKALRHGERPPQVAGGFVGLGIPGKLRVDPLGHIVALVQQAHLKPGLPPRARRAVFVPQPHPPVDALPAVDCAAEEGPHLPAGHLAAAPDHDFAPSRLDLVGRLGHAALAQPTQPGLPRAQPQGVHQIFRFQCPRFHGRHPFLFHSFAISEKRDYFTEIEINSCYFANNMVSL